LLAVLQGRQEQPKMPAKVTVNRSRDRGQMQKMIYRFENGDFIVKGNRTVKNIYLDTD